MRRRNSFRASSGWLYFKKSWAIVFLNSASGIVLEKIAVALTVLNSIRANSALPSARYALPKRYLASVSLGFLAIIAFAAFIAGPYLPLDMSLSIPAIFCGAMKDLTTNTIRTATPAPRITMIPINIDDICQDYSFYGVMSNMNAKRRALRTLILSLSMLMLTSFSAFALDYFAEGERLFRENRPEEAIPLLYQASLQPGVDPRVFVYLGLGYQQTGKYADAVSAFMRGASAPGTDRKVLFFNAGNVYFLQELFAEAESMYVRAAEIDASWAPVYLNRANARVRLGRFAEAAADYRNYLMLDPATWQKDSIRQIIALLESEETERKNAELRSEAERVAAEAERAAAAERYQRIMDEVSSSLQSVDAASTLSAGSEDVMEYNEEAQLE